LGFCKLQRLGYACGQRHLEHVERHRDKPVVAHQRLQFHEPFGPQSGYCEADREDLVAPDVVGRLLRDLPVADLTIEELA